MKPLVITALALAAWAAPASALDRPWIADVFFYWYTWDDDRELGSWIGGIHNTPLEGYYDSRTFRDNHRSLWQASEWGMTHHFMDYWTPTWKGEDGQMREAVVMRAAESLREAGYDIWMSYYQDSSNFAMREFSRNVSEKRDVHQWLRDFARSPVWPKIDGRPLQLVYARNGRPQTSEDHAGFRAFLKERYDDVDALNKAWRTDFAGFDAIEMTFSTVGHHRAAAIEYQYRLWKQEWDKLDRLVEQEFQLPGMRASFDVGYGPFMGFGFADFTRTFGGPHSYAGIFAEPNDQDALRFIQAAVAKRYDTVFFDHLKNFYFDWDIRVPGTAYLPDPFHFDRFWAGALGRHSEAVLHLSWNEWWEGSNLEPCKEFGKTYCEKNLFYSTLMKLAFESIRTAGDGAPVALLLNDWRLATAAPHVEELYGTVQILRRLGVPFALLPDEMVTAGRLEDFRLVVAPAYGSGLGYNGRGEPILEVLTAWLEGGDRRLIISSHPTVAAALGLRRRDPQAAKPAQPGEDLNLYVDVGTEGDEVFLRSGSSGRETGMRFGDDATFRWTPAAGSQTSLVVPSSPGRDHTLRLFGNALWANRASVIVNAEKIGAADVPAGPVDVAIDVPAAAIGAMPMASVRLDYAAAHVPGEVAPERYPGEQRVCNLSLCAFQWSTANVPAGLKEARYTIVDDALRPATGAAHPWAGGNWEFSVPFRVRPVLDAPGAAVLSRLRIGDVPRDVSLPFGPSRVLSVAGPLSEVESEAYWLPLLRQWARVDFHRWAVGRQCVATRLSSGDTDFVVCYQEDAGEPRPIDLHLPSRDLPLSEAAVLSRDGATYEPLAVEPHEAGHRARDTLRYYGVYQFAFSSVKLLTPKLTIEPGQEKTFWVEAVNLTDRAVGGRIEPGSTIPTVSGEPVAVELGPKATKKVAVSLRAAATVDWGKKAIYFNLAFGGRRAVVLRDMVVEKPTDVEVANVVLDVDEPLVELRVPDNPYGQTAPLIDGRLTFGGHTVALPEIPEGGRAAVALPAARRPAPANAALEAVNLEIELGPPEARRTIRPEVFLARKPKSFRGRLDAAGVIAVFNPRSRALEHEPLAVDLPAKPTDCTVRSDDGAVVPSQFEAAGRLRFLADVPSRSAGTFHLSFSPAEAATDLRTSEERLGSGKGTLEVANSHWQVTLSEAAGGTVTGLRSLKTNRDYGQNTFGIAYGTFSRREPGQPRVTTTDYIHEEKVRQEDTPGRIEIVSQGPAAVIAEVCWADRRVEVEQIYEFPAFSPFFVIRQKVRPLNLDGQQELVALDAKLVPHRLTKSYPNFVGVVNDRQQPHFGWRQGAWVPDYATLMAPDHFDESVSLVISHQEGLTGVRQGFWPHSRPAPGNCATARVELLADTRSGCDAEIHVLIHPGHQIVAKRFLADLRMPPRVDVIEKPYGPIDEMKPPPGSPP
ncbi:MAG: hypothetical protein ACYTG0_05185 [Planctomycetota bacterium]|jgi:hypothetical protein